MIRQLLLIKMILICATAWAQVAPEECLKAAEEAQQRVMAAESKISSIDSQIGTAGMAAGANGASEAARVQITALKAAVESRRAFSTITQNAAALCEATCGESSRTCEPVKMRAMTASMELGQMQTQLAQSEATGKQAGTQVAIWVAYCPDGSHSTYDSLEVASIAHKGFGCKIRQK